MSLTTPATGRRRRRASTTARGARRTRSGRHRSALGALLAFVGLAGVPATAAVCSGKYWYAYLTSAETNDAFGTSVAAAGDVDADGFAHAMVGAPSSGRDSGGMLSTFLLEDSNRAPGLWSVHSPTTAEELPWIDAPSVGFGSAVAPLGPSQGAAESDYYDFAVGAAGVGRVYLVGISTTVNGRGSVLPPRERHGTIAPASVGLADGLASGFGTVAEAVPDRDGDGYPEVMLCGKNDAGVGLCSLVFVDPQYRDGVEAVKSYTILDATVGFGSAAAVVPSAHLVGHPEPLLDDPSALVIAVVAEDGATLRILAFDAANAAVGVWELDVETAFADPAFAAIRPPSLAAAGWGCSISALPPVSGADPRTLDFVVGAEHYRDRGAVFGISLSLLDDGGLAMTDASTVSLDFAVSTWTGQPRGVNTPQAGDRFGRAVAVMSDLDSDGGPDLIVGAPGTGCCGAYYQVFLRHGPNATAQCAQDRIDARRDDDDDDYQRDDANYAASPVPTLAPPTGGFFGFAVFIGVLCCCCLITMRCADYRDERARRGEWPRSFPQVGHRNPAAIHARRRPVGLTAAQLAALPTSVYVAKPTPQGEDQDCCAICLVDFEPGETLKSISCAHKFHGDCIDEWLARRPECPLCKRSFVPAGAPPSPPIEGGGSSVSPAGGRRGDVEMVPLPVQPARAEALRVEQAVPTVVVVRSPEGSPRRLPPAGERPRAEAIPPDLGAPPV